MTVLNFVSAPGGSAFMHELLATVADEVARVGPGSPTDELAVGEGVVSEVRVSEGPLRDDRGTGDSVFVVVPHEYFVVLPEHLLPGPEVLRRTIGFCVEHPGNETFETTVHFARQLAACVDINDDSLAALQRSGVTVERFVLGYAERWDRWRGADLARPRDVVYLGTEDERRSRALAQDLGVLEDAEVLVATPPHEPMTRPRPDFFMGTRKLDLLARTKVLLNLHRGRSRSLEWVRVLEALCNGCAVVSEHSLDYAPLSPGEHLLFGRAHTLGHLARSLVADPARLDALRTDAYAFLRSELTMRPAARSLARLASAVGAGDLPVAGTRPAGRTRRRWPLDVAGRLVDAGDGDAPGAPAPRGPTGSGGPAPERRDRPAPEAPGGPERCDRTVPALPDRDPDSLDVVIVEARGWPDASVCLAPLVPQLPDLTTRIHLCCHGTAPGAPADRRVVVHRATPGQGIGALLSDVVAESDASELLVLASGDQLATHGLARLRRARRDRDADASCGMTISASGHLASTSVFEPRRLAERFGLDSVALWRRSSLVRLGGWRSDLLDDEEAHADLWRRLAASGGTAVLVSRPVARRVFGHHRRGVPGDLCPGGTDG